MELKYVMQCSALTYQPCPPALYNWRWSLKVKALQLSDSTSEDVNGLSIHLPIFCMGSLRLRTLLNIHHRR